MSPIKGPHRHQTLKDRIVPITPRSIDSLFLADAAHISPQDIIIGKTFQGIIMPMTLLETLSPCHNDTVAHLLRDLGPLG